MFCFLFTLYLRYFPPRILQTQSVRNLELVTVLLHELVEREFSTNENRPLAKLAPKPTTAVFASGDSRRNLFSRRILSISGWFEGATDRCHLRRVACFE